MGAASTLIVFPASLNGGRWAAGPRVKPELVSMCSVLRRHEVDVEVLDLENAVGNPAPLDREAFLNNAEDALRRVKADLVAISCSSTLQYKASTAVAAIVRRLLPEAAIAVTGFHVSARPEDFVYEGSPFDFILLGDPELALVETAEAVAESGRPAAPQMREGIMLEHGPENAPDYASYRYTAPNLPTLPVFLSRGCPYPRAACQLRPGAPGWHAFAPDTVVSLIAGMTALAPRRIDVLDPAFGLEAGWRRAVLERFRGDEGRRAVLLAVTVRPETVAREDLDAMYEARMHVRFDVDTLSADLLERTAAVPSPSRHVDNTLDLLRYANAKGIAGEISLVFNQPGETVETAAETLDRLEEFYESVPNASLKTVASAWAYYPYGDAEADIAVPYERYGTRIIHPEWWREGIPSEKAATAVVASREMENREPGDDGYWRPRFDAIAERAGKKLTPEARRGLRSHEWEGSLASGVPHGFWVAPRL